MIRVCFGGFGFRLLFWHSRLAFVFKIFFKQPRKVVDRAETESVCDLADCVLILADQLFTFLKFNIEQIVLWRGVQVSLEQRLQRRT